MYYVFVRIKEFENITYLKCCFVRNVYWTETSKSAIMVARHDGNYKKTLLLAERPTAIVVDPELG